MGDRNSSKYHLTIYMTPEFKEILAEVSERREMSMSEYIRDLVANDLYQLRAEEIKYCGEEEVE